MQLNKLKIYCLLYAALIVLTACVDDLASLNNDNQQITSVASSSPRILEFNDTQAYFDYRQDEHSLKNDRSRGEDYVLVPSNPLPNSILKNVSTVENVYIASYYELNNDFKNKFNSINQSYERELSSEVVCCRYIFDDPEYALMESFVKNNGYELMEYEGTKYYYRTDYIVLADSIEHQVCHNIAYLFDGQLVYVRFPAFDDIKKMLHYAAVEKLYSEKNEAKD